MDKRIFHIIVSDEPVRKEWGFFPGLPHYVSSTPLRAIYRNLIGDIKFAGALGEYIATKHGVKIPSLGTAQGA
jgi:hypothetical protein